VTKTFPNTGRYPMFDPHEQKQVPSVQKCRPPKIGDNHRGSDPRQADIQERQVHGPVLLVPGADRAAHEPRKGRWGDLCHISKVSSLSVTAATSLDFPYLSPFEQTLWLLSRVFRYYRKSRKLPGNFGKIG